ncbi:MAG: hypothetical protein SFV20_13130 [Sphingopyxis sp.]|nr:hypothetical protein [Sphingopyxis sp.]
MPQPQPIPTGTPTPQQQVVVLEPVLVPPLVTQVQPQVPVARPDPQRPEQTPPLIVPPQPQQISGTTANPPGGTNATVTVRPLDTPTFSTAENGIKPEVGSGSATVLIIPADKPPLQGSNLPDVFHRPRQFDRPKTLVAIKPEGIINIGQTGDHLPTDLVASSLGRHPAHRLPTFELADGNRQCLVSGFGRRQLIDAGGQKQSVGLPPTLRGFGPIMRDVPAFSHRTAGCVILVKRRKDEQ